MLSLFFKAHAVYLDSSAVRKLCLDLLSEKVVLCKAHFSGYVQFSSACLGKSPEFPFVHSG